VLTDIMLMCSVLFCSAEYNTSLLQGDLSRLDAANPYRSETEALRQSLAQLQEHHARELAIRDGEARRMLEAKIDEVRMLDESRAREMGSQLNGGAASAAERRAGLNTSMRSTGLSPLQTALSSALPSPSRSRSFGASMSSPTGTALPGLPLGSDRSSSRRSSFSEAAGAAGVAPQVEENRLHVSQIAAAFATAHAQRSTEVEAASAELQAQREKLEAIKARMRRALADSSTEQSIAEEQEPTHARTTSTGGLRSPRRAFR
jgi:hypothetical protein